MVEITFLATSLDIIIKSAWNPDFATFFFFYRIIIKDMLLHRSEVLHEIIDLSQELISQNLKQSAKVIAPALVEIELAGNN